VTVSRTVGRAPKVRSCRELEARTAEGDQNDGDAELAQLGKCQG